MSPQFVTGMARCRIKINRTRITFTNAFIKLQDKIHIGFQTDRVILFLRLNSVISKKVGIHRLCIRTVNTLNMLNLHRWVLNTLIINTACANCIKTTRINR